jgi:thymidine kinase
LTDGASFELLVGPMFSGKTARLISELAAARRVGLHVRAFKPSVDPDPEIVSLAGPRWEAISVASASEILADTSHDIDVVGLDEVQFFMDDVVDVVAALRAQGLRVIAAGLDLDFRAAPFGPVPQLERIADNVVRLTAICQRCGAPATRSQRVVTGRPATSASELILVGGPELYEARCERCYEAPWTCA